MQYPCWGDGTPAPQDAILKTVLLTSLVYAVRTVLSDVESKIVAMG